MKTKTLKNNKVNIVTLGCSKNLVDSEVMLTQLRGNGINAAHQTFDDAQIVIINTCGFIDNAKEESVNTILTYADAKQKGLVEKVYVTGCLSERYKEELQAQIPQVDAWFGTRDLPALLKKFKADYKHELLGERLITTPTHYAFLKISEGCDRPCSFCAIPIMRGKHISTPIESLVAQARTLAAKGTKELILIAQDLTYYGLDLYNKRSLSLLLRHLSEVEGIEWIRLQYAYPSAFPMDVLEVMNERENICKYLDMPLQHISDNMLKIMRRGITRQKTIELINTIRDKVPGISLRTTLIAGHPGETKADFYELLSFVEDTKFERLGIFNYSHEEHTHAGDTMKDDVPAKIKKERAQQIMTAQEQISEAHNYAKISNTYKVLFDRVEGGYYIGRTEADSPDVDNEVLVDTKDNFVRLGDFAQVTITSVTPFDLYGVVNKYKGS
ncbi:MAG: 30S ribosomal protein S12 methylthiotransferase RimO [Cytophagales bacterium]|nr:30S ribosomal protein S12 methylthiotransferase RimO [Cytophagales bacterium]